MQARLTTKPAEQVISAIQALDLEPIKLKVMDPELGEGWTREYADSIELAYKNYLTMLVKFQDDMQDITLSKDVDEFWHAHILQTMKYADDCQRLFGNFPHQNPHTGPRTPADVEKKAALAEKTCRLYQREFGHAQANSATASCDSAVKADKAAYCAAAIKAEKAAYCAAEIRVEKAAYCAAEISAEKAAYCAAEIRVEKAAYCAAEIRAEKAAYCAAEIRAENGDWSKTALPATLGDSAQPGLLAAI